MMSVIGASIVTVQCIGEANAALTAAPMHDAPAVGMQHGSAMLNGAY